MKEFCGHFCALPQIAQDLRFHCTAASAPLRVAPRPLDSWIQDAVAGKVQGHLELVPILFQCDTNQLAPCAHFSFRKQLLESILDHTL